MVMPCGRSAPSPIVGVIVNTYMGSQYYQSACDNLWSRGLGLGHSTVWVILSCEDSFCDSFFPSVSSPSYLIEYPPQCNILNKSPMVLLFHCTTGDGWWCSVEVFAKQVIHGHLGVGMLLFCAFEQEVHNLIPHFSGLSETELLSGFQYLGSITSVFICNDTFWGTETGWCLVMLLIGLVMFQKGVGWYQQQLPWTIC